METLLIDVPDKKSTLVKMLLKELGVKIKNQTRAKELAEEINKNIKPGPVPTMEEIVAEIREYRAGR
jgi:hypothetical protein